MVQATASTVVVTVVGRGFHTFPALSGHNVRVCLLSSPACATPCAAGALVRIAAELDGLRVPGVGCKLRFQHVHVSVRIREKK